MRTSTGRVLWLIFCCLWAGVWSACSLFCFVWNPWQLGIVFALLSSLSVGAYRLPVGRETRPDGLRRAP